MTATLRCPYCNARGLEHLAAHEVGHFSIVYCGQCGAIHGIIALPPAKTKENTPEKQTQESASPPEPAPATDPAPDPQPPPRPPPGLLALAGNTDLSLAPISPDDARQRLKMVSMYRGGQRFINVVGKTGVCPTCNREMVKMTIPEGYENSGRVIYYCPNYDECGQWYFVFSDEPNPKGLGDL